MAKRTKTKDLKSNANELAKDILTVLCAFTRKVNINSSASYNCSSEVIQLMDDYQESIENQIDELDIENLAIAELKKQLSTKMKEYFERQ